MYIAAGQGQTTPGDNRNLFISVICYKFKKKKKKKKKLSDFIQVFMMLHVYSPGAGAENRSGQHFDVNRNLLSLWSFATSLNKTASHARCPATAVISSK